MFSVCACVCVCVRLFLLDASSNVHARAVKDYCNAHDASHIAFREGDLITVRHDSLSVSLQLHGLVMHGIKVTLGRVMEQVPF